MKKIALLFITIFLVNYYSFGQGPKAPEAGSFEPVDATDMVSLLTGDLTYVLPLMVIPSPEGGYPINLAYHGGIAMDQEASWVGLGWNLNPGVINRSINGFPDDYNRVKFHELFYEEYQEETNYRLSVGYGDPSNTVSVGLEFSWGTNRSLSGGLSYSIGFGLGVDQGNIGINGHFGTNGSSSIGIGYTGPGGMSFGASVNSNGIIGGNAGFSNNSGGFSISASSNGGVGFNVKAKQGSNAMGLNFKISDSGVGISASYYGNKGAIQGAGIGANFSFANTIKEGDYVVNQSRSSFSIIVPTPIGTFSGSFGKQKISWFLNNTKSSIVYGPLYFNKEISSSFYVICRDTDPHSSHDICFAGGFNSYAEAQNATQEYQGCSCSITETSESFMDVYEFPLEGEVLTNLDENNLIFPSYDSYNVQGQGISGNIAIKHFENANLFSLSNTTNSEFNISFKINGESTQNSDPVYTFDEKPYFYFENEYAAHLATQPVTFNYNYNFTDILDHHSSSNPNALARRKTSNVIEYFTKEEVQSETNNLYQRGYIQPKNPISQSGVEEGSIQAFTVISADGKKYHYSIPVMNYASVTRTIGAIKDQDNNPKEEERSYFEKIQDSPYATHWLLTAITGPDYIDVNNNHKVDEGDYGYWIEFEYGKWSEAFAWKTPYGKEYIDSNDDDQVKINYKGYKDVYYLDAIKTRTHTAFFSKELRSDYNSYPWSYESIDWGGGAQTSQDFEEIFNIPKQKSLSLHQIILLKNEDVPSGYNQSFGDMPNLNLNTVTIDFPSPDSPVSTREYNREDYVYTKEDIPYSMLQKAIKVIDFKYISGNSPNSLANDTPNSSFVNGGRLTLEKVNFKGKRDIAVLPPYEFSYYNTYDYDLNAQNSWGYNKNKTYNWSLQSIKTPEGGEIIIEYEADDFVAPVIKNGKLLTSGLEFTFGNYPQLQGISENSSLDPELAPETEISIRIDIDEDSLLEIDDLRDYFTTGETFYIDMWFSAINNFNGNGYDRSSIDIKGNQATITELNQDNMTILVNASSPYYNRAFMHQHASPVSNSHAGPTWPIPPYPYVYKKNQRKGRYNRAWVDENGSGNYRYSLQYSIIGNKEVYDNQSGDIRVKSLTTTDGIKNYTTKYYYNSPGSNPIKQSPDYISSGTVAYIPNKDYSPIPFSAELPSPKVMYEHVTSENFDSNGDAYGKTKYTFNVMNNKTSGEIKFEDFLDIYISNGSNGINNNADKEVDIKEIIVEDNLSAVGQLLSIENFNKEGQLLSKTINEYFNKNNRTNNQGIEQESFQTYKEVDYHRTSKKDKWIISSSTRINYSQALKSSTNISGNNTIITNYKEYDDVSGGTLETTTTNSEGQIIKNKIIPAYKKYSGMASRVENINNSNMLSQTTAAYTLINENGNWEPIGVGITTWNNSWVYKDYRNIDEPVVNDPSKKIWRKHKKYIWDGPIDSNGSYIGYNLSNDDGFNWNPTTQNQPQPWKKVSETILYDHFSSPLEIKDINGNFASSKMTDKESKVLLNCNAGYDEAYYTGVEYENLPGNNYLDHGVFGESFRTDEKSHTGSYSAKIDINGNHIGNSFGTVLRLGKYRPGIYKVSVWVHKENYKNARFKDLWSGELQKFNGEKVFAGNWVQLNHYINLSNNQSNQLLLISTKMGSIYVDDFRVHPIESSMTSYVYNKYDELTFLIGPNNLATKYRYNAAGKLRTVYIETVNNGTSSGGFKKSKEYQYNYKREVNNDNNCPPAQVVEFNNIEPNSGDDYTYANINAPAGTVLQLELSTIPSGNGGSNFAEFSIWGQVYTQATITYTKTTSTLPVAVKHWGSDDNGAAKLKITAAEYTCPTTIGQVDSIEDYSFNSANPIVGDITVSNPQIDNCGPPNQGWTCAGGVCRKFSLSINNVSGGNGSYSFQWQYKYQNNSSYSNIPGSTNSTNASYSYRSDNTYICGDQGPDYVSFRCVVTDSDGNSAIISAQENSGITCHCTQF